MSANLEIHTKIQRNAKNTTDILANEESRLEFGQILLEMSESYNIPGIHVENRAQLIRKRGRVTVSDVGGNVMGLQLDGVDLYPSAAAPFTYPYINHGQVKLGMQEWYRHIGHDGTPLMNRFEGKNLEVLAKLRGLTGQDIPDDTFIDTGHHGEGQTLLGRLEHTDAEITWTARHVASHANLFSFMQQKRFSINNGIFTQVREIFNDNDFPIPVTLIGHPYFLIPGGRQVFDGSTIVECTGSRNRASERVLYNLGDYHSAGEQRFALPLETDRKWVEFRRGDGVTVKLAFFGNGNTEHAGLQVFSNGPTPEALIADAGEKFEVYRTRRKAIENILIAMGILTEVTSDAEFDMHKALIIDYLQGCTAVCIEDVWGNGNWLDSVEGLEAATIVAPNESVYFGRRTSVLPY
jgi:hypothetical protein